MNRYPRAHRIAPHHFVSTSLEPGVDPIWIDNQYAAYARRMRPLQIVAVVAVVAVACKKPAPPPSEGTYLPALGKLASDPKVGATATKADKDATVYTHQPPPGIAAVSIAVAKEKPAGWHMTLAAASGSTFSPYNFAPKDAPMSTIDTPHEWFDLTAGPLKGSIVHLPGSIGSMGTPGGKCTEAHVYSLPFFLSKADNFEHRDMMRAACGSGRSGVKGAITKSDFLEQCNAKGKSAEVLVSAECEFRVRRSDGQLCIYDPKKGKVEVAR